MIQSSDESQRRAPLANTSKSTQILVERELRDEVPVSEHHVIEEENRNHNEQEGGSWWK